MLKVLILHGWHGSDAPHWQAWLSQELVLDNCIVAFPQLPDKMSPDKEVWVEEALAVAEAFRPDVVIAHSLGNILWFHLCSRLSHTAKKLLLCAPPRDLGEIHEVETFFPAPLPDNLHASEVLMVASDSDPYLSVEEARSLAAHLEVPLKLITDAGHINAASGFGPWPWAKEWVLS